MLGKNFMGRFYPNTPNDITILRMSIFIFYFRHVIPHSTLTLKLKKIDYLHFDLI